MPKTIIKIKGWECSRCGHKWIPKEGFSESSKPISCPNCKSPYWNKPRKNKK